MSSVLYFFAFVALISMTNAQVSQNCLDCICQIESGCRPLGCKWDVDAHSCGYYQIKRDYYIDCNQPGRQRGESTDDAWKRCTKDKGCSEKCIQAYMKRYASRCRANPTCEDHARLHNGGPSGCKLGSTVGYWRKIQQCL